MERSSGACRQFNHTWSYNCLCLTNTQHCFADGGGKMIWQPKPGQLVRLQYRKSLRAETYLHMAKGFIKKVAKGPKTKNCLVVLPHGYRVVVPRGNLFLRSE